MSQSNELRFRIEGMDCMEEVHALKKALLPVVKTEERLSFSLLTSELTVLGNSLPFSPEEILAGIKQAGLRGELVSRQTLQSTESLGSSSQILTPFRLMIASAVTLVAATLYHALTHEGIRHALFYEEGKASHAFPIVTIILFSLSILAGIWHFLPKAWRAIKKLEPDMNLLMAVAIMGAVLIGEWFEAATVAFLFSLSLVLESWSVQNARRSIGSLLKLAPDRVRVVLPDGSEQEISPEQASVGMVFRVRPGERVPLDGVVVEGYGGINQTPITGESLPVRKEPGSLVFAGTVNVESALTIRTTKASQDTTLARIIRVIGEAQAKRAQSEQWVEKFAKIYTPCVLGLAILTTLIPPLLFAALWEVWFYRALTLLVIACPCALVISTPVSIVAGLASAARNGILIKGGKYLEIPSRLKAIAFDKTGTLTQGKPVVVAVHPLSGHSEKELLERMGALEAHSDHPLAHAILEYGQKMGVKAVPAGSFQVILGKGAEGEIDGKRFWIGSHRFLEEKGQETAEVHRHLEALTQTGQSIVIVGNSTHVCGYVAIADEVRENATAILRELKVHYIAHTVMLTGDNQGTAERIGKVVGVDEIRAELLPEDKLSEIDRLTKKWGSVAMVGDGINDAPAMARSSLAIAMGAVGSDTAIETADIALMSDDLSRIPWLIRHSRRTLRIIQQNITLSLAVKLVFVVLTALGQSTLWGAIAADTGVSLLVIGNALRLVRG